MWRPTLAIVLVLALAPQAAGAQDNSGFSGRPLAEVLTDLQAEGLQIVFSTAVVQPSMVVRSEPQGDDLRNIRSLSPNGYSILLVRYHPQDRRESAFAFRGYLIGLCVRKAHLH